MIERLRDTLAPRRAVQGSETGYRRLLRWAALPVTDRRWAPPLSAVALGFGLFVGVAIGPGASGTFATGAAQIIEIPSVGAAAEEASDGGDGGGAIAVAPSSNEDLGGEEESSAFAPIVAPEEEAPETLGGEESPGREATPAQEEATTEPEKQQLAGTVIQVNPAASSYTVAEEGGVMSAIHAGKLPAAGAEVEVPIQTLANGTLAEAGRRIKTGSKQRATLVGIVTFVDANAAAPAYTVSNKGTSVLVRVHPDPAGAVPSLPGLGAYVSVAVDVEAPQPLDPASVPAEAAPAEPESPLTATPTCAADPAVPPPAPVEPKSTLWQHQLSGGGAPFTHSEFEGIVAAVCPDTAQLLISADGIRESGKDLLFAAPPTIDTTKVSVGESVLVAADIAADGSLTLTGLASDERLKGADDEASAQGDLVTKKPKK